MNKIEFITGLLADKKLSLENKERIFLLASTEIRTLGNKDGEIWAEIEKIKKVLNIADDKNENPALITNEIEIKHTPRKTSEKLLLFKTGNGLKWITHIYPNSETNVFNYDKITKSAIAEYRRIAADLPKNLSGIINLFLNPKKGDPFATTFTYLGQKCKTWWADEIKDWCSKNEGLHPDTNEKLSEEIITPFKKSIEIRDGVDLISAIKYVLQRTYGPDIFDKIQIDFSGVRKSTRFFTGVDQLMTGVAKLFAPILKRVSKSKSVVISTSLSEINDSYVTVIRISHLKSRVETEFSSTSYNILSGDLLTAKEKFLSLCDWNIYANFENGSFKIPALDSNNSSQVEDIEMNPDGFTHELIFY